jgi:cold shock CspA family protein
MDKQLMEKLQAEARNETARDVIKRYISSKGYGFLISPAHPGEDLFYHVDGCYAGYEPVEGDEVTFVLDRRKDGRFRAIHIKPA